MSIFKSAANDSPSPWGEGWGEGGQPNQFMICIRPHPNLLPRGEGTAITRFVLRITVRQILLKFLRRQPAIPPRANGQKYPFLFKVISADNGKQLTVPV